ncbi:MAG: hypothetical protein PUC32_07660 [Oscillospiraceae bacterium]|nr:hypothetical protein [Oscillospiraceae bacterium]
MAEVQEFQCPCCGGAITFDSTVQKMKCPYCDSEFDVNAFRDFQDVSGKAEGSQMNWESTAGQEWADGEAETMRVYVCKSCGGEIIGDETTAATSCPFCGNPVVMTGQVSGDLKPDYVIPFKLDKQAAKQELKKHLKGKIFLPKAFKTEHHIDEIKGVYVPFWLFDADADADIQYKATRIRTWRSGDYDYTETSFYACYRSGTVGFQLVPVDGSTKMADDLMESIEPFDFSDAVDFETAYLSGYFADRYDVSAEESVERANTRIRKSTEEAFRATVNGGYATVVPERSNIELRNSKAKYALDPVWLLNTTWNGQKYTFAMNGQTGKFVGDLPTSKGKLAAFGAALVPGWSALALGVLYILWRMFL